MALAQLTWHESLRDMASLSADATKLYATGFVKRSMLADANESRDWRLWADLAAVLIHRARRLYASEPLGVDLDNTVDALDSSTIDLSLLSPSSREGAPSPGTAPSMFYRSCQPSTERSSCRASNQSDRWG